MDCRPLSTVDNFGFRYLQRVLKLPTFSRGTISRLFDAEHASLVMRPIEAQLQQWNEKHVLVFGRERFEFQNDLTAGFDGWGVGCFTFESGAVKGRCLRGPSTLCASPAPWVSDPLSTFRHSRHCMPAPPLPHFPLSRRHPLQGRGRAIHFFTFGGGIVDS